MSIPPVLPLCFDSKIQKTTNNIEWTYELSKRRGGFACKRWINLKFCWYSPHCVLCVMVGLAASAMKILFNCNGNFISLTLHFFQSLWHYNLKRKSMEFNFQFPYECETLISFLYTTFVCNNNETMQTQKTNIKKLFYNLGMKTESKSNLDTFYLKSHKNFTTFCELRLGAKINWAIQYNEWIHAQMFNKLH